MLKAFTPFSKLFFPLLVLLAALPAGMRAQVLFDNGPYYNSTGTGAGGANESVLYTTTFGMGTIGFGHQIISFNRVADDFTFTDCAWRIDSIVFFAYQTGSTTTSTMTAVNLRIWDSIPDAVGSSVIFGDTTTNRMIRSVWSGAYRITETTVGNTTRPIMRNVINVGGFVVNGGTYWLDWASAGSLASGPWAPARTPVGVAITGNGRQRVGSVWNNAVDGGTGTPAQGFPFIVYGTSLATYADAGSDVSFCPGSGSMIGGAIPGSGGQGPLSYMWSPGASLSDSTVGNPVATPGSTTTYVLTVTDSVGCVAMDTVLVTVGSVTSSFLPADTFVCDTATILLDAGAASSWMWSSGDTTQTINAGVGTWSVSAYDALGCASVDTIMISNPLPATLVGDSSFCEGDTLFLSSTNPSGFHVWSTGDTTSMLGVTTAGTYTVMVTDAYGCTSTDSITVASMPLPSAMFTYSPGAAGLDYNFTDLSLGGPVTWDWNFGDGGTSTSTNPTHTYGTDGVYTVTLIVTNSCGSDTMTSVVTVVADEGSLAGSTVDVSPNPAGESFVFTVSGLKEKGLHVELTDLQGKVQAVWDFQTVNGSLSQQADVSRFARGVYFIHFTSGTQTEVRKITLL